MSSRDRILGRLRRSGSTGAAAEPPAAPDRDLFRDYPSEAGGSLLSRFAARLVELKGEFYAVAGEAEAARALLHLLDSAAGPCASQESPLIARIAAQIPELAGRIDGPDRLSIGSPAFAGYAAGITAASCLVARTGSVVLISSGAGGRRLSVMPPLHIVLARSSQVVGSLDEAFAAMARGGGWSCGTVITGPSRTADIEKILVLGAHGPRRLAVVVIE